MKLILLLLFVASHRITAEQYQKEAIIGGRYTQISKVPYQAMVELNGVLVSAATIISNTWLISSVHGFINRTDMLYGQVRTGTSFAHKLGRVSYIKKIIIHPLFERITFDNNIALIELQAPIIFSQNQQPIPIAHSDDRIKIGNKVTVSGYGVDEVEGGQSSLIKVATLKVVSNKKCGKIYKHSKKIFCAKSSHNATANGDSGGPGVIKGKLYGIISSESNCIRPSVFVKTSEYYPWILLETNLNI